MARQPKDRTRLLGRLIGKAPGLAKTRRQPLVKQRQIQLWQSTDYRWREMFESADVISEGATRDEPDGTVYYGSTSILLALFSHGGAVPDQHLDAVTKVVSVDPHARVRAIRIACLEAQLRSGGPIGRVRAEVFVRTDPRGVRIDVEIEARVYREPSRTVRPAKTRPSHLRRKRTSEEG